MISADRSLSLIEISASSLICDASYRNECFVSSFIYFNIYKYLSFSISYSTNLIKDFVISIAVIHHFTTPERRLIAIKIKVLILVQLCNYYYIKFFLIVAGIISNCETRIKSVDVHLGYGTNRIT